MKQIQLSNQWRKLSAKDRLKALQDMLETTYKTTQRTLPKAHEHISSSLQSDVRTVEQMDSMIESSIGALPIPIGIVPNLIVDNTYFQVPLATEESSVIAGASYAAKIFANATMHSECIKTTIAPPLQVAQIAMRGVEANGEKAFNDEMRNIKSMLMEHLASMQKRGGGLRRITYKRIDALFVVYITIDVCDVMGANRVNTAAEYIAPHIQALTGGALVAAIVSNYSDERIASAEITLNIKKIPNIHPNIYQAQNKTAEDIANNIDALSKWAEHDIYRATTHNKGIMNGVSGLALATGNDTRAIEAASHTLAASLGIKDHAQSTQSYTYKPLSKWEYNEHNGSLHGYINIPALFATKGGVTTQSVYSWSIALLQMNFEKEVGAHIINRVAAGLGLAQNFAALLAISTSGIQKGHMALHKKKDSDE